MRRAKRTMDEFFSSPANSSESVTNSTADAPAIESEALEEAAKTEHDQCCEQGLRKKRRTSVFWSIYVAVFALLTVIVVLFTRDVNRVLADYESARPGYVAEDVFNQFFVSKDAAKLLEKSGFALSEFETLEHFSKVWTEKAAGELSFLRVSSDNGAEVVRYNVHSGETTVATFELKLSGEMTERGNPLYELSSVSVPFKARERIKISVPSQSTVFLNGLAVSEKYETATDIPTFCDGHIPEGVLPLVYSVYEVDGLLFPPSVSAVDKNGNVHTLRYDEEAQMYVADIIYDDALKEEMADYVTKAATTFASFMQQGSTRAQALSYIEPGTDLYKQTQVVDNYWVSAHSGERFDKLEVGEFYAYDENTFSCRVSFVHVLTGGTTRFDENGENRENVDITWYYRKVGDKFLIYDRENN